MDLYAIPEKLIGGDKTHLDHASDIMDALEDLNGDFDSLIAAFFNDDKMPFNLNRDFEGHVKMIYNNCGALLIYLRGMLDSTNVDEASFEDYLYRIADNQGINPESLKGHTILGKLGIISNYLNVMESKNPRGYPVKASGYSNLKLSEAVQEQLKLFIFHITMNITKACKLIHKQTNTLDAQALIIEAVLTLTRITTLLGVDINKVIKIEK